MTEIADQVKKELAIEYNVVKLTSNVTQNAGNFLPRKQSKIEEVRGPYCPPEKS